MSDAIREQVATILQAAGVTYKVFACGTGKPFDDRTVMDKWSVSFASGKAQIETDFHTGTGHRQLVRGFKALSLPGAVNVKGQWQAFKVVAPHAADVLACCILDMSAESETFANWCDNFGYDSDSIKARETYDACQRIADKMRRVFTGQQIEQLREALQEY